MIEDVFEGVFRFLGRFLGYFIMEILFELLIKGPGYFISKLFTTSDPDPDGLMVVLVGLMFWVIVGVLSYSVYINISG